MTPEKYKALILATGGFTKDAKRGDHPQRLTKEDDAALSKAWKTVRSSSKTSPERDEETNRTSARVEFKS